MDGFFYWWCIVILDVAEWIWEHRAEVTFNTLLLFILRKFILTELIRLLRFGRNDHAVLNNLRIIMRELGVESEWTSHGHGLNFTALKNSKKWLPIFTEAIQKQKLISRRKIFMEKLKSRKFWLTILAALIPVLNVEFGINLDLPTIIAIMGAIMGGVGALAHVDAKKVLASIIKPSATLSIDSTATYTNTFTTIKAVHDGINDLLKLAKENDTVTLSAYGPLLDIIKSVEQAKPLEIVPEQQVSA